MHDSLITLLPALVTILLAFFSRQVAWALFAGITTGCIIISGSQLPLFLKKIGMVLWSCVSNGERLMIVAFIVIVASLSEVMARVGVYERCSKMMQRFINSGRRARLTIFAGSLGLFFDDYANILIIGSSTKSITAAFGITAAYAAYIIDNTALFAAVAVVSTWAAYEGSIIKQAATTAGFDFSTTYYLISILPYHYFIYCTAILSVLSALTGRWSGTFFETKDNGNNKLDRSVPQIKAGVRARQFLIPMGVMLVGSAIAIIGIGFYVTIGEGEGDYSLISILGNAPTITILLGCSILSTGVSLYLLLAGRVTSLSEWGFYFFSGIRKMVVPASVILLAKGLADVSQELGAGTYIASRVLVMLQPAFIPALIFCVAIVVTIFTGFSWSSMAILMPLAADLVHTQAGSIESFSVIAAAIIGGSVAGGLLIPFSDTSVMTAAACGIRPEYHVKTQAVQVFCSICAAFVSYLLAGHALSPLLCLLGGGAVIVICHIAIMIALKAKSVEKQV